LPPFHELIEAGKVCALNFPVSLNPGLAKAIGVMMKLDFQRAVVNRVPKIEANPNQHFRQVFFICDEYQHFATVGENDPTGDEKFFAVWGLLGEGSARATDAHRTICGRCALSEDSDCPKGESGQQSQNTEHSNQGKLARSLRQRIRRGRVCPAACKGPRSQSRQIGHNYA
jgi:hypothetical protein